MASNLRVIKEAKEAAARGPAPDGEGYAFEELAGGTRPVASDDDDNAASLAFLDQMATV